MLYLFCVFNSVNITQSILKKTVRKHGMIFLYSGLWSLKMTSISQGSYRAQFIGGPQLGIISSFLNSDAGVKGRVIIPILQMKETDA